MIGDYGIEELPNLHKSPTALYKHKDGRVRELPADPYHLKFFQNKGLVLVTEESAERTEDKPLSAPPKKRKKRTLKKKQTLKI